MPDLQTRYSATEIESDALRDETRIIASLINQAVLSRATDLARIGRYDEAEILASSLRESPAVFDLLARIRAQQGRLREAETHWQNALRLDSMNHSYKEALQRIAKIQSRPAWLIFPHSLLLLIISILFAAALFFVINKSLDGLRDPITQAHDPAPERQAVVSSPSLLSDLNIDVPGVVVKIEASRCRVTFDSGLFARGDQLKPESESMLTALGRRLESKRERISLRIVGHTDDAPMPVGSRYRDNISLGLSRAIAVHNHLLKTASLPSTALSVSSAGESQPIYPNDTRDNRARNRTVSLFISEAGQ